MNIKIEIKGATITGDIKHDKKIKKNEIKKLFFFLDFKYFIKNISEKTNSKKRGAINNGKIKNTSCQF